MRLPAVGRTVIYRQHVKESGSFGRNGTLEHPAIVTRVLPDGNLNLTVLFDGGAPQARCGVKALPETEEADVDLNWGWRWLA